MRRRFCYTEQFAAVDIVIQSTGNKTRLSERTSMYIPEHFCVRNHRDVIAFMLAARTHSLRISRWSFGMKTNNRCFAVTSRKPTHTGNIWQGNRTAWLFFTAARLYFSGQPITPAVRMCLRGTMARSRVGNARVFFAPEELLSVLHELIPMFEAAYGEQWASLSQSYRQRMLGHIIGFVSPVEDS